MAKTLTEASPLLPKSDKARGKEPIGLIEPPGGFDRFSTPSSAPKKSPVEVIVAPLQGNTALEHLRHCVTKLQEASGSRGAINTYLQQAACLLIRFQSNNPRAPQFSRLDKLIEEAGIKPNSNTNATAYASPVKKQTPVGSLASPKLSVLRSSQKSVSWKLLSGASDTLSLIHI